MVFRPLLEPAPKCEVQSVCDYLGMPGKYYEIFENSERCSSREKVMEACTEGIGDLTVAETLKISPNPASGTILIETGGIARDYQFLVHNITGGELLSGNFSGSSHNLDISGLPPGLYFVKVIGGKNVQMGKFVKE